MKRDSVYAASQPARVKPGVGMPTNPAREPDTTLRHVSTGKVHEMTLCHFLMPNGRAKVALTEKGDRTTVAVKAATANPVDALRYE